MYRRKLLKKRIQQAGASGVAMVAQGAGAGLLPDLLCPIRRDVADVTGHVRRIVSDEDLPVWLEEGVHAFPGVHNQAGGAAGRLENARGGTIAVEGHCRPV